MRWPSKEFRDYTGPEPGRSAAPVIQAPRAVRAAPTPQFGIGFSSDGLAAQAAADLQTLGYDVDVSRAGTFARRPWLLVAAGYPAGVEPGAVDRLLAGWADERGGHYLWFDTPPGGVHG